MATALPTEFKTSVAGKLKASKDGPVLTGGFSGNPLAPIEPMPEPAPPFKSNPFKDIAVWDKKLAHHFVDQVKKKFDDG